MSELVLREHTGAVATVTLNRPAALNAVYGEVFRQLWAHLAAIDTDTSVKLGNMHLTQTSDFKEAVAAWRQQSGQSRCE
jgi:hypothetical protein